MELAGSRDANPASGPVEPAANSSFMNHETIPAKVHDSNSAPMRTSNSQDTMWEASGHTMLPANDPENPMNWSMSRKLHASAVASLFTFVLLFAVTSYSAGVPLIVEEFGVSPIRAVLPQSVFIFGIIAAPVVTPHIAERVGRNVVYFSSLFIMSIFVLGASRVQSFSGLVACRFFAGLFGGPIAVNIEGTYADMWPATFTGTYYTFITSSQYFGAATGAIVGGALVNKTMDWRWTQYITLMLALAAFIFAIGVGETYPREILRRRARRAGVPSNLEPAASGVTFAEMSRLTLVQPLQQLVTDPVTAMSALYLSMAFGVTFQWFITVPPTLTMLAHFTPLQVGLAFLSAVVGTVLAAVCTLTLDQILARRNRSSLIDGQLARVEHRLVAAIVGSVLLAAGIFWVAQTASPAFSPIIPIVGTGVFVWGSAMTLTAFISYLFDAYDNQTILPTLSVVAYARLATAGWLPLVIIPLTTNLTPKWGLNLLGFFAAACIFVTVALYVYGARLRKGSRYLNLSNGLSPTVHEAAMHQSRERSEKET